MELVRKILAWPAKYAGGEADRSVKSSTSINVSNDMVYMGISRIYDQRSPHSLTISAIELEMHLNTFRDACPKEVLDTLTFFICFGEGHGSGRGDQPAPGSLCVNAYRSPTKAEIADAAATAQSKVDAFASATTSLERAQYERLHAKFGAV